MKINQNELTQSLTDVQSQAFTITHLVTSLFVSLVVSAPSLAQVTEDPARPFIGRSGEVFAIRFTPKSRSLEVSLVGKPTAKIDPSKITVLGRVLSQKGEPRNLAITKENSHFTIKEDQGTQESGDGKAEILEIEVKDNKTKKSEKFQIENKHP